MSQVLSPQHQRVAASRAADKLVTRAIQDAKRAVLLRSTEGGASEGDSKDKDDVAAPADDVLDDLDAIVKVESDDEGHTSSSSDEEEEENKSRWPKPSDVQGWQRELEAAKASLQSLVDAMGTENAVGRLIELSLKGGTKQRKQSSVAVAADALALQVAEAMSLQIIADDASRLAAATAHDTETEMGKHARNRLATSVQRFVESLDVAVMLHASVAYQAGEVHGSDAKKPTLVHQPSDSMMRAASMMMNNVVGRVSDLNHMCVVVMTHLATVGSGLAKDVRKKIRTLVSDSSRHLTAANLTRLEAVRRTAQLTKASAAKGDSGSGGGGADGGGKTGGGDTAAADAGTPPSRAMFASDFRQHLVTAAGALAGAIRELDRVNMRPRNLERVIVPASDSAPLDLSKLFGTPKPGERQRRASNASSASAARSEVARLEREAGRRGVLPAHLVAKSRQPSALQRNMEAFEKTRRVAERNAMYVCVGARFSAGGGGGVAVCVAVCGAVVFDEANKWAG